MSQLWTIKQVAKTAGTTSRTLRHYDHVGLLKPAAIGENGYRLNDASALIRLQRILALRNIGLSLSQIQSVLDRSISEIDALSDLEQQLVRESSRLERQIASIQRTLDALRKGESPMSETMFDGFEHERYKEEIEERWGKGAWQSSQEWWSSLGKHGQAEFQETMAVLIREWKNAHAAGVAPESVTAQDLARRQVDWLHDTPGPHARGECTLKEYVVNLADMYVNDPRFAETYGGEKSATLVRDALKAYAEKHL